MRLKSSLATLAGAAMLVAACAAPVVTPAPTPASGGSQLPARPAAPVPPTPTTIVRVVDVGAVPVPTATPVPPAPTARPVAPTSPATPRPAAPTPIPPAVSPAPVSPTPRALADGTFVVGTEIAPGTYRAPGGQNCYWARLKGFGGSVSDVITNGAGASSVLVAIATTDAGFESRNCGAWTRVS